MHLREERRLKRLFQLLVKATKPIVWRLANAYDLKVERPLFASGQHSLMIRGDPAKAMQRIPKSAYFNTRSGTIEIGEDTIFGEDVMVLTGKHFNIEESEKTGGYLHEVPDRGRDVVIGRNCYIGSRAIIVGPVRIGDYAVVGAGSVVTKDVGPRTFVAGVPAKTVRAFDLQRNWDDKG